MGPLDGLRILDLTSVLMGPYATSILGDMEKQKQSIYNS